MKRNIVKLILYTAKAYLKIQAQFRTLPTIYDEIFLQK